MYLESNCRHCINVGEDREEVVPIDLPTGGPIRQASPKVDYQLAVQIGRDLNSNRPVFADGDVDSFLDDTSRTCRQNYISLCLIFVTINSFAGVKPGLRLGGLVAYQDCASSSFHERDYNQANSLCQGLA